MAHPGVNKEADQVEPTLYQQLRIISDAIETDFTLRPYQELVSYEIKDDTVLVALTIYKYTETVREVRLIARGTRIMSWTRGYRDLPSGGRIPVGFGNPTVMTLWDDDYVPETINKVGKIESLAEYRERRDWEAMQYRVGSRQNPMDNAERSADPTYSPMHNYWMKG